MKKCFFITLALSAVLTGFAQKDSVKQKGFKKENLFTGGSFSLGFSNGTFLVGVNPVFGYSLTHWADAGIGINYTYQSQRDVVYYGDKARQHLYGGGPFLRLFPVRFLFAQAQFEHNIIQQKYIPVNGGSSEKIKVNSNSLLVGAGYTSGRVPGGGFYYLGIFIDAMKDTYSPYRDELGRVQPIFRAGFHIPLFGGNRYKD